MTRINCSIRSPKNALLFCHNQVQVHVHKLNCKITEKIEIFKGITESESKCEKLYLERDYHIKELGSHDTDHLNKLQHHKKLPLDTTY